MHSQLKLYKPRETSFHRKGKIYRKHIYVFKQNEEEGDQKSWRCCSPNWKASQPRSSFLLISISLSFPYSLKPNDLWYPILSKYLTHCLQLHRLYFPNSKMCWAMISDVSIMFQVLLFRTSTHLFLSTILQSRYH